VIFGYWTKMLDLIAVALNDKGLTFHRIDGQSSLAQREEAMEKFNNDPACDILLASIGAAGEGCVAHFRNSPYAKRQAG
jgi:SNF2 family DNA or RNA helicase